MRQMVLDGTYSHELSKFTNKTCESWELQGLTNKTPLFRLDC